MRIPRRSAARAATASLVLLAATRAAVATRDAADPGRVRRASTIFSAG